MKGDILMVLKKKVIPFIIILLVTFGLPLLVNLFTPDNAEFYMENIVRPSFAPPSIVFPIVWTILFILMSISAYIIYQSDSVDKKQALVLYVIQLIVNSVWTYIFFGLGNYFASFLWIILLIIWVIIMIISFSKISKPAALLQIPYLLWLVFAGILNLAIYLLNK